MHSARTPAIVPDPARRIGPEESRAAAPPHDRSGHGRIPGGRTLRRGEGERETARRRGGPGLAAGPPIREARVQVEVNGRAVTLVSANVSPAGRRSAGVQVDCPVTKGYLQELRPVRGLLGPGQGRAGCGSGRPARPGPPRGRSSYPARQRWFAGADADGQRAVVRRRRRDAPTGRPIYYHSGLDIGGCEGLVDVVSASDGLVVSAGGKALPEYADIPFYKRARYDYVYVLDCPGLVLSVRPPQVDRPGDPPGGTGQDGAEDRRARQGGVERRLVAPALRHQGPAALGQVGHPGGLRLPLGGVPARAQAAGPGRGPAAPPGRGRREGRRSTARGPGARRADRRFEWTFSDGTHRDGPRVERDIRPPGQLQRGPQGRRRPGAGRLRLRRRAGHRRRSPTASCRRRSTRATRRRGHPPGRPGDVQGADLPRRPTATRRGTSATGARPVAVRSDGNVKPSAPDGYAEAAHRYAKPGHYLVRVERAGPHGGRRRWRTSRCGWASDRTGRTRPSKSCRVPLIGWCPSAAVGASPIRTARATPPVQASSAGRQNQGRKRRELVVVDWASRFV